MFKSLRPAWSLVRYRFLGSRSSGENYTSRPFLIVVDDVEDDGGAQSHTQMFKVFLWTILRGFGSKGLARNLKLGG